MLARRCLAISLCLSLAGCVRTGEDNRDSGLPGLDLPVRDAPAERPRDLVPRADRSRTDAAVQRQVLKIAVTGDDGEISGGELLPSGETWWGNLIHTGSWATAASGGPTMTYAYLRHRLARAVPAGSTIASATLSLFGHALTGGSQWSSTLHKLIISADLSPDAAQVASAERFPGGPKGAPQTKTALDWGQIVWKPDAWNTTPNLAAIVQELVDAHGGLEAGAHLQLWLRAPAIYPVDAELPFEDLDHANARAAVLSIEWVE